MRKKSHISLAKYIVNNIDEQGLCKYRKSFYFGNLLPDIKPSFITERHEIDGTFKYVEKEINRLSETNYGSNTRAYYRDLGQVVHYVSDYFTFPHNSNYPGSLAQHCVYEEQLKDYMREYIKSGAAAKARRELAFKINTPEAICNFIKDAHDLYMMIRTNVEKDVKLIVELCFKVVEAIIQLLKNTFPVQVPNAAVNYS
jgi:hypothetical protein